MTQIIPPKHIRDSDPQAWEKAEQKAQPDSKRRYDDMVRKNQEWHQKVEKKIEEVVNPEYQKHPELKRVENEREFWTELSKAHLGNFSPSMPWDLARGRRYPEHEALKALQNLARHISDYETEAVKWREKYWKALDDDQTPEVVLLEKRLKELEEISREWEQYAKRLENALEIAVKWGQQWEGHSQMTRAVNRLWDDVDE